tara:strand:+ start:1116 stop:1994 length:879 start_codon:yes stop_codon:yes gene_type:complete
MGEGNSLINLGDLSKPAAVLIEKVSDAVGGIAKPWQIQRVAKAEAKAEIIRAQGRLEISELEERALLRMVREEGLRQENIENVTARAIPLLTDGSQPEAIDNDWLAHFFDRARLISNEEMQALWSSILAGQANEPRSFTKRTIDLVATLDKFDAELFSALCKFCWQTPQTIPFIFDVESPIYKDAGLNFTYLTHLDSIGLIRFENVSGFVRRKIPKVTSFLYFGKPIFVEFSNDENALEIGNVLLTQAGQELYSVCKSTPLATFLDYTLKRLMDEGVITSSSVIHKSLYQAW